MRGEDGLLGMELRRVEFGSEGYRECLALRRAILRVPLELEWSEEDLAQESEEWHFGIWDGSELVGALGVRWLGAGRPKLRQMAVRADRQGSGVGRRLLEGVLEKLREEGVAQVELHARETVVKFYEKAGFEVVGGQFEEVGLPHWRMKRQI